MPTLDSMWAEYTNSDLTRFSDQRDLALIRVGFILAATSTLQEMTAAVPREKAPHQLVAFVSQMHQSIDPNELNTLEAFIQAPPPPPPAHANRT